MQKNLNWKLIEKYNNYQFFYNGPFSNWYPSNFVEVFSDNSPLKNTIYCTGISNRFWKYKEALDELIQYSSKQKRIKLIPTEIQFNCSEQYMMFYKALTFHDYEIAEKILTAEEPHEQKTLGRQVKKFNVDEWSNVAKMIVYEGCYLKFTQNQDLKDELLKTKGALLVEASPTDTIWGIGRGGYEKGIDDVKTWKGSNWLGEVLTVLRDNLEEDNHCNYYEYFYN